MDWLPINFDLIRHPMNWVIVMLMVMIFGFVVDLSIKLAQTQQS